MACPETGARSVISYGVQTDFNTPFTGTFQEIPVTSFGLDLTKETLESNAMTNTKEVERHGNKAVGGDLGVELCADTFDDFLEGAFYGTWDTSPSGAPDQLIIGTTAKYFTFQDAGTSIGQYRMYNGCVVSSTSFSVSPGAMITPTFTFLGKDGSISQTGVTTTGYTKNDPFDSYSGDLLIGDSGSAGTAAQVTAIDFTIDHGLDAAYVIGSKTAVCIPKGQTTVSGSLTIHYTDEDVIERFLDEIESNLEVSFNDPSGNNEYKFIFPRIKVNSASTAYSDMGARFVEVSFSALEDDTYGSPVVLERPETV